jgi:hypothetical protein
MYDGAIAMGEPKTPTASLLPSGQGLDLFVTLTDYHGYRHLVQIHDPPLIYELEHRHVAVVVRQGHEQIEALPGR